MQTQQDRLLAILMERGEKGVYVYELIAPRPKGLGIAQYNARIKELRTMGYNIVCVEKGRFVLRKKNEEEKEVLTKEMIEKELKFLREVWEITPTNQRSKIEKEGKELRELLSKMEVLL